MGGNKNDNKSKPKINRLREFSYTTPLMFNGTYYPSQETTILDNDNIERKRKIGVDANNNYFYIENGQPHFVENYGGDLDEVTVIGPRSTYAKKAIEENKQKQAYMKAVGYNVPQDGSWGPWQQSMWTSLTRKPKQYDNTIMGLANGLYDKITGNDTETTNPLYQGEISTYNPDNVDWGKTRRSQSNVVNTLSGTWGPGLIAAGLPSLIGTAFSAPIATAATIGGGTAGGWAANKASKAITGRDIGTNVAMHTPLTPGMGDMLNPGYIVGGYGAERRMLDALYNQVTPVGYENMGSANVIPKTKELALAAKDFFTPKRIRTSIDDIPAWKHRIDQNISSDNYGFQLANTFRDDAWRLAMRQKPRTIDLNGEKHSLYVKNPDGKTYSYDLDYINQKRLNAGLPTLKEEAFPIFTNKANLHDGVNNVVAGDIFTGNGGFVGAEMNLPKDWEGTTPINWDYSYINTNKPFRVYDKWDTQPFLEPDRSLSPTFSKWLTKHPNKLTNYIRNFDAVEGVGGNPFMLDMQVEPNVFQDIIVTK